MDQTLETFIDEIMRASSTRAVGQVLRQALTTEGYENIVFVKTRNSLLHKIVWAELPTDYAPAYYHNRWDQIDPVLKYAATSTQPFLWEAARRRIRETKKLFNFFEECRELGVHTGLTIPFHGPGGQTDLVSLSVREKERPSSERLPIVYAMAFQAWLRHSELEIDLERKPSPLSKRELECLCWIRDGKTNAELAELLGVSERTVEFHTANIFRKLGVRSRVEAVVVGLQSGIILL